LSQSSESAIYKSNLEGETMNTYVILRRGAWGSPPELGEAAERSTAVGEQMPDDVRWIRSYVLDDLAVDEIIPVADTVIVRPDPVTAPAS
jgi:hypothetical protein